MVQERAGWPSCVYPSAQGTGQQLLVTLDGAGEVLLVALTSVFEPEPCWRTVQCWGCWSQTLAVHGGSRGWREPGRWQGSPARARRLFLDLI